MKWSSSVRHAMKRHVQRAIDRLDPIRYSQEPAYVAALMGRLDGVVYKGEQGRIEIQSTIVTDRAPNSAEYRWGADFGIVAILDAKNEHIEKGVLAQAKKSQLVNLNHKDIESFSEQCWKMRKATDSILGLEVPRRSDQPVLVREIKMDLPRRLFSLDDKIEYPPVSIGTPHELADYLADRFLLCKHGDKNIDFVRSIGESKLTHLVIIGETAA